MLGKLIKYDLYYNWKLFVGLMAALLIWGAVGLQESETVLTISVIMVPVMAGAGAVCVYSVIRSYYRSLYSRQGYLTMTLPTTSWSILGAKTITTTVWFNAVAVVGVCSVVLYMRRWVTFDELPDNIHLVAQMWVMMNAAMLCTLMNLYLAMTIANVSINGWRLGFWGGLLGYLAWTGVQNLFSRLIFDNAANNAINWIFAGTRGWTGLFWGVIAFNLCFAAAGFVINALLMRKNVNLQ